MEEISVTPKVVENPAPATGTIPVPLQSFLGIENPTDEQMQQLQTIWDFADAENETDKLYQIRQLEDKIGMPNVGQTRLHKIYQYVKITNQIKSLEKLREKA